MKKSLLLLTLLLAALFSSQVSAQSSAFTFVHISDLHVSTVTSAVNLCDLNGEEAKCYLQTFNNLNPRPAFILATGDISNIGNSTAVPGGMYRALTQYLYPHGLTYPGIGSLFIDSAQTIPIYFAPGNHEYYTTLTGLDFTTQTLPYLDSIPNYVKNIAPDTDYAVTTDISVILFMRSGWDISYLVSTDPKGSSFSDAQIAWMTNQLSLAGNKKKMLVMHHPAANYNGTGCSTATHSAIANDSSATFYYNRDAFIHMCDSFHVDVILAGHSHQNVVVDKNGNQIDENCDTCGTRYVQTGPAFGGCYRSITVDSSFVTVSVPLSSCIPAAVKDLDELHMSVYPDPSNGIFTLNMGQTMQVQLKVYNLMGQCVHQQSALDSNVQIDLRNQASGIYFLQLVAEQGEPVTYNFKYPLVINR